MSSKRIAPARKRGEQGTALIEFMLCFGLFWVPLFFGTLLFGFNLIRAIQVTQVCRDAGHMYAFNTDFTQPGSQHLLVTLAPSLNMTPTGGNGVVVLSTLTYADSNLCQGAGLQPDSAHCPNLGQIVFTNRIVVGSSALHVSAFGTPAASIIGTGGNILASNYLTDPSAVASNFSSVINLQSSSQFAYVSEMWVTSPDFNFWNAFGPVMIGARSVF